MELMTEVKKGFKQTDVGLIPEDWDIIELSDCVEFLDEKRKPVKRSDREKMSGHYPYYGASGIIDYVNDYLFDDELILLAEDGENILSRSLPIAFQVSGKIWVNNHAHVLKPKDDADITYLTAFLESLDYSEYNSGTAQPKLNKKTCKQLPIVLPLLEEQQAIASALSDVDELICSLDGLIQKKQAIKKGAMQQLLTGKKRLLGFDWENEKVKTEFGLIPKDWELISLEEATVNGGLIRGPFGGALKKEFFVDRGIKVYEQKNAIYKTVSLGTYYINEEKFRELSRFEIKPDDFIVSCSGTIGKIFRIPNNAPKGVINQALLIIRIDDSKISLDYFNHYFSWNKFQERIIDNTHGGAMKNLVGMDKFRNTLIPAPATLEEQQAIAQILSDMDRELQTLRQKREKYVQIKQGMMQELLTGKTRLVKKEATIYQLPQKRNENFEDAVFIAAVINRFGSGDFKLNRFRYQKYVYLLKRYVQASTEHYMKKAAGPYNPKMRYRGGESVAIQKGYVEGSVHNGYDCFIPGNEIEEAIGYFQKWYGEDPLQWLDQLQYSKNGELELLTTVDMAMQEILKEGHEPDVQSVKEFIKITPKWKKKLEKPEFTESGIEQGIQKLEELFAT